MKVFARRAVVVALLVAVAWFVFARNDATDEAIEATAEQRTTGPSTRAAGDREDPDADALRLRKIELCGTVVGADDGRPIAGAVVHVRPTHAAAVDGVLVPGGARQHLRVVTGSDGGWRLPFTEVASTVGIAVTAAGRRPDQRIVRAVACEADSITIELRSGGVQLVGTISDATGGELGGALVVLRPVGSRGLQQLLAAPWLAICDDEGRYAVSVEPGLYEVGAMFSGYAEERRWVQLQAKRTEENFSLLPGGRIEGRVVFSGDERGEPQASVSIAGERAAVVFGGPADALTDDSGHFVLEGVPPGEISLVARSARGRTPAPVVVELGPGGYVSGIEVVLEAAPSIGGTVVERGDPTRPVAGARVLARGPSGTWMSAPTDQAGAFRIEAMAPGEFQVSVDAEGQVDNLLAASINVGEDPIDDLVLTVDRGVALAGIVRGGGEGTSVRLSVETEAMPQSDATRAMANALATTTCGADGRFRFDAVAPGTLTVIAEDGSRGFASHSVTVGDSPIETIELELSSGSGIAGEVTEGGRPGASVRVGFVRLDPPKGRVEAPAGGLGLAAITDETGRFSHAGLEPGRYRLQASRGAEPLSLVGGGPTVELGRGWQDVALAVVPVDGELRGRVVDADGEAIVDAVVQVGGAGMLARSTLTDEQGRFTVSRVASDGELEVLVTDPAPGGGTERVRARAGADVTVELSRGSTLDVTTSGIGSGQLVVHGPRSFHRTVARDGVAKFVRVPPGTYEIEATGDRGIGTARVEVGEHGATASVPGKAWATVEGRLVDGSGALAGWSVFSRDPGGSFRPQALQRALLGQVARTDDDGRFEIDGVFPGPGELVFVGPEGTSFAWPLQLSPGERHDAGDIDVTSPKDGS